MYKMARLGEKIERETEIEIYSWDKVKINGDKIEFEVSCSSGTYVRSLAYIIGKKLGTVGHISSLRRLKIGPYDVKDAISIESIKKMKAEDILKCVKIL